MVQCTTCVCACRHGDMKTISNLKDCPINTSSDTLQKARAKYNVPEVRKLAQAASRIEAKGYMKWTRLEETMEFARLIGANKIGIACCVGLRNEARIAKEIMEKNGFEIASVVCKTGCVLKEELGLRDDEKVNPGSVEPMCNPVAQAMLLADAGTDLNVLIGLCVGHDSLFMMHSKAPVTVLVAKDRVMAHNPIGAIYQADKYYRGKLRDHNLKRNVG